MTSYGVIPDRRTLADMRYGWGNTGFSARVPYLEEMCRLALNTREPILECGSGLSTILLGLISAYTLSEIISLDHDPTWYESTRIALQRHKITNVNLRYAPLRNFGSYNWYDLQDGPIQNNISLVICDGPPSRTGGRYGLMPRAKKYLNKDCVILLDDIDPEREALELWMKENDISVCVRGEEDGRFAVITLSC